MRSSKTSISRFYKVQKLKTNCHSNLTDLIVSNPTRHVKFISHGLTVEPESSIKLGVELIDVSGAMCTVVISTKYGRLPAWTSTSYDNVEFIFDGVYRHTGQIDCQSVDKLLREIDYRPGKDSRFQTGINAIKYQKTWSSRNLSFFQPRSILSNTCKT